MAVTIEGNMSASGHKIGIVVSRWNGFITEGSWKGQTRLAVMEIRTIW